MSFDVVEACPPAGVRRLARRVGRTRVESRVRAAAVAEMRMSGETWASVGRAFGVSRERVRGIDRQGDGRVMFSCVLVGVLHQLRAGVVFPEPVPQWEPPEPPSWREVAEKLLERYGGPR